MGCCHDACPCLQAETGYRTSAGISCSKMLAKLVSGMHKPDDQTIMLPPDAPAFVATLPVRAIPGRLQLSCTHQPLHCVAALRASSSRARTGVGYKLEGELTAMGVRTAMDLRASQRDELVAKFGERIGAYLYGACRGDDPTPVQQSGPARSITVEDSFKSCTTLAAAVHVLRILAPDLLTRLKEDHEVATKILVVAPSFVLSCTRCEGANMFVSGLKAWRVLQEYRRRPSTMTLKWRQRKQGWSRTSTSCPMPIQVPLRGRHPFCASSNPAMLSPISPLDCICPCHAVAPGA